MYITGLSSVGGTASSSAGGPVVIPYRGFGAAIIGNTSLGPGGSGHPLISIPYESFPKTSCSLWVGAVDIRFSACLAGAYGLGVVVNGPSEGFGPS